jgi:hypothetical protein
MAIWELRKENSIIRLRELYMLGLHIQMCNRDRIKVFLVSFAKGLIVM